MRVIEKFFLGIVNSLKITDSYFIINCIIEKNAGQPRILYGDDYACALSGLSKEELQTANPKKTVEKLRDEIILDF